MLGGARTPPAHWLETGDTRLGGQFMQIFPTYGICFHGERVGKKECNHELNAI